MNRLFGYLVILTLCALLGACGGKKADQIDAAKYFQEGERLFEKKLYNDAIAAWEKVRDTYYSPELSMLAEIKIADAYFISEQYPEAATAYADFLDRHPNDSREGTLLFRLGLSYYKQILSADRDQSSTENARATLQKMLERYPDHPKADEAKVLIIRCKTRLAEHEIYVGRFYLKKKQYRPAIMRLENALKQYPDYYYRDEAYYSLIEAYVKSEQKDKARIVLEKLKSEFPRSDYLEDAEDLLAAD